VDQGKVVARLRTYERPDAIQCKLYEAARATSAAPFYFPPQVIGFETYFDGGLVCNNPIMQVYLEFLGKFEAPAGCIMVDGKEICWKEMVASRFERSGRVLYGVDCLKLGLPLLSFFPSLCRFASLVCHSFSSFFDGR